MAIPYKWAVVNWTDVDGDRHQGSPTKGQLNRMTDGTIRVHIENTHHDDDKFYVVHDPLGFGDDRGDPTFLIAAVTEMARHYDSELTWDEDGTASEWEDGE